ncbi:MAG: hypothetical protein EZS28_007204 [Streblomastix strix]|uniref:Uncharacterized protein n=1 Tax=Streblomastix strix TaxID=222440 RepID=A0A5J4WT37_9EUKA|nr:MAG: hypothetical protein EZS28_007204 [Streblomastix strix]
METMELEQLQARFQRFESAQKARVYLLSQVIEDKRAIYTEEIIKYIAGTDITSPLVEFYNNNISSPENCDAFIDRVYQHENGRLFKCAFDFGTTIQSSEFMIYHNQFGRDLTEALNPGRIRYKPLPFPGKNMEELIKIHSNKRSFIKYIHVDDDYKTYFFYNLICITILDSNGIEIDRYSRIAEVPQRYEVPIIGFNCLKSAKTLIFTNFKSNMGNSFVIHRENIAGKTQILKFKLQDDQFLWFLYEFRIASTNSIYKSQGVYAERNMCYIHVIYGDTDSLCLTRAKDDRPAKNKQLWDELYLQFFPSTNDYYDIKKKLV